MAADGGIGTLAVRIGGDATELLETFSKASKGAKDFGNIIEGVKGQLKTLAAALAPAAVIAWTKSMADAADQAGKTAQKVGMTTEAFSELSYSAKLADLTSEQLTIGLVQLSKNMVEARDYTSDAAAAFRALGVAATDGVLGPVRLTQQVLFDLADKFARMEDSAGKTALAVKIFGRSGAEMIPLLNQGSQGLRENAEEARKFGVVISTQAGKEAEQFNDNLRRLQAQSGGLAREISGPLIKALGDMTSAVIRARTEGKSFFEAWAEGMRLLLTGNDAHKIGKELTEAQERLFAAQNKLDEVRYTRSQTGPNPFDDAQVKLWTTEVAKATENLKRLVGVRKELLNEYKGKGDLDAVSNMLGGISGRERAPDVETNKDVERKRFIVQKQLEGQEELNRVSNEMTAHTAAREVATAHAVEEYRIASIRRISDAMAEAMADPMRDDESNRSRRPDLDQRQLELVALGKSLKSQQELENEAYAVRMAQLRQFSDAELELIGGRQAVEQNLAAEHQDRLSQIRRQGLGNLADFNKASWADQTAHVIGSLADMTAAAAQHNRGMFEINKVASMANAIVKGWEAVQSSYAFGSSWGGPIAGAAMAAIAATATAINVMAIKNASFGGGASPSVSTVAAPPVQVVNSQQNAPIVPTNIVHLHGDSQKSSVLLALNEELRNGGKLVFVQDGQ